MSVHAKLLKVSTLPEGIVAPFGARDAGPITDGYYVLGHYDTPPKMGHPFVMTRYNSNGVEVGGVFTTSPVSLISRCDSGEIGLKTANSIYRLIPL